MLNLRNKQNSLSFKVGLGFSTIAIVLITALSMTIFQLRAISSLITQVATTQLSSIRLAANLLDQIDKIEVQQALQIIPTSTTFTSTQLNNFNNSFFQSIANMELLINQSAINSSTLQKIQANLLQLKTKLATIQNNSALLPEQKQQLLMNELMPLIQAIHHDSVGYRDEHEAELLGNLQQAQTRLTSVSSIAISFLFIGIILCSLMTLILTRSITQPIYALVQSIKRLATGNLNEDVTIIGSREFEELSQSLNNVMTALRSVAQITEKIAMGDYSQRVTVKSDHDQLAISVNQMLINFSQTVNQANAIAQGDYNNEIIPRSSIDKLGIALQNMTQTLRQNKHFSDSQNWLKDGLTSFARIIGETQDLVTLCQKAINEICRYTGAGCGVLYVYNDKNKVLELLGSYAFNEQSTLPEKIALGSGIIGQAGLDKKAILIRKTDQVFIQSATIKESAETLYCVPIFYEKILTGVLEIAWNHDLSDLVAQYLDSLAPMLASHMQAAYQQKITEKLLDEQKSLTEKLQVQQNELRQTAAELSLASKYKSEFLANMSHELRTPLNSLIILAKLFADNKENTLTSDQVESAKIMVKSGHDLLTLINDILDLAKVEAGKLEIQLASVSLMNFLDSAQRNFKHVTEEKHIALFTEMAENLPDVIATDEQRVSQIIRNFLSNAIKFTEKGHVKLLIERAKPNEIQGLPTEQRYIAFRCMDTGVGIPKDKQELVFEAFQQADGTISRKYGGTGLGLSISTQFANLLHGAILLESTEGVGSTFSLIIPENANLLEEKIKTDKNPTRTPSVTQTAYHLQVDENPLSSSFIQPNATYHNELVLVVDDDMRNVYALSQVLKTIGLNVIVANNGQVGLDMLAKYPNTSLILMDIMMPIMNGYEAIAKIRENPAFQKTPIIAITAKALSGDREKCIQLGASDFLSKPIDTDKLLALLQKWIPAHDS